MEEQMTKKGGGKEATLSIWIRHTAEWKDRQTDTLFAKAP